MVQTFGIYGIEQIDEIRQNILLIKRSINGQLNCGNEADGNASSGKQSFRNNYSPASGSVPFATGITPFCLSIFTSVSSLLASSPSP